MPEFDFTMALIMMASAFFCEYVDSTLGMGYGTTLTPIFLLIGFGPRQIVPAILFSEFVTGLLAAVFHHFYGNVDLKPKTLDVFKIRNMLSPLGYIETARRTLPLHLQVAIVLSLCSIAGAVTAVFVAVNISKFWLNIYIGSIVLTMGLVILALYNKEFKFSWKKIAALGLIASFNKGMSGGGYGPVVTSGQILSGVEGKGAIGITSLAESLTCLVGLIAYFFISEEPFNWKLTLFITTGAVLSVPLSAKSVKLLNTRRLTLAIAVLTIVLGLLTLIKTLKPVIS